MKADHLKLSKLFTALTFAAVLLAACVGSAQDGTRDGGGGNVCELPSGQLRLLELANQPISFQAPDVLESNMMVSLTGRDFVPTENLRSYQYAVSKIDALMETAPRAAKILRRALKTTVFLMTDRRIVNSIRVGDATRCAYNTIYASAFYLRGVVLISIPSFNKMDFRSQAGLFIHEAARRIQLNHGVSATDTELENIVVDLLAEIPWTAAEEFFLLTPYEDSLFVMPQGKFAGLSVENLPQLRDSIQSDKLKESERRWLSEQTKRARRALDRLIGYLND